MSANWDMTYGSKAEAERSWTQSVPAESLAFIARAGVTPDVPVIDIGGGASRLVDELLASHHTDVTVLDVSATALAEARRRVDAALPADGAVHWIVADVTEWIPHRRYGVWHDRAVFHFLVQPNDQRAYVDAAQSGVAEGGALVMATFAPTGPESCSGQSVTRWSADELHRCFAQYFDLVESAEVVHTTPWGAAQPFTWVRMHRRTVG